MSETMMIMYLQRVVEKKIDLREIHVLDSVWRSMTGSSGKFTCEIYYELLRNAVYHHDLNNAAGQKKRQAFISQQVDSLDESDHDPGEDTPLDQYEDDSSPYSTFQSSFNSQIQKLPRFLTEFRQPLQVQSHLEMPGILVQLGHTQRT